MEKELSTNVSEIYELSEQIENLHPEALCYFECGFCIRHGYTGSFEYVKCENCEITKSPAGCCLDDDSLYDKIINCDDNPIPEITKEELIEQFIEIIKNIPEENE